jgi:hypothetical protein
MLGAARPVVSGTADVHRELAVVLREVAIFSAAAKPDV